MKRLVVVADNPLIVGAIRTGLRDGGAFQLLGYVDPRKTTAARITQAGAEVVLVDEGGDSEAAIALIQSLREQDENIKVIVLALRMEGSGSSGPSPPAPTPQCPRRSIRPPWQR